MFHWYDFFWRVRHRHSPFPLPFAPSHTDFRSWHVEVSPPQYVLPLPIAKDGIMRASLHRILIEAGIALSLATTSWDPRSWFPLYRYGGDFAGTAPNLRFYEGVLQKDPRLTTVASEEVATGITCYVLREHLALDHIADVYACIDRGELEYVNANLGLRPDYYCEDANGETLLAESKGATGTRSAITGQMAKGKAQVQNVRPVNRPLRNSCGRVTIGTHFCIDGIHPRSETTTLIEDPVGLQSREENPESDVILRVAYAKCLRFAGQDILADRLLVGELPLEFRDIAIDRLRTVNGVSVVPLGLSPFGDALGLYGPTAKALFGGLQQTLRPDVIESLAGFREVRNRLEGKGYALPNGIVVVHDPDDLH